MASGLLSAGLGLSKTIGFDPISSIGNLFGGSASCTDEDLKRRDDIAQKLQQLTTYQERQQLTRQANSNISPNPKEMANFIVGGVNKWGGDCKHKNVGQADKEFMNQTKSLIQRKIRQQQQAASQPQAGGGGSQQPASGGGAVQQAGTFQQYGRWIVGGLVSLVLIYLVTQQ